MTNKKAIEWLKLELEKGVSWDDTSESTKNIREQAEVEIKEAFDMAIKSLEAWDRVKEEMQEQYRTFANIPSVSDVWADAIEIVNKHLKEVNK